MNSIFSFFKIFNPLVVIRWLGAKQNKSVVKVLLVECDHIYIYMYEIMAIVWGSEVEWNTFAEFLLKKKLLNWFFCMKNICNHGMTL